jgi:hypothetical protein
MDHWTTAGPVSLPNGQKCAHRPSTENRGQSINTNQLTSWYSAEPAKAAMQANRPSQSDTLIRMGRTRMPAKHGTFYGNLDGKFQIRTRIPAATNWIKRLCETKPRTTRSLPSLPCGRRISRTFAPFGRFTHSPPMCSCSLTSTSRRAGNTPSHTSHMVFLHGPRPVSHVTPPGIRHSRPRTPTAGPAWSPTLR